MSVCEQVPTTHFSPLLLRLGGGQFALPGNLEMSVRQLLHAIECACAQGSCSESRSQASLVRQDHLLDCIMAYVTR